VTERESKEIRQRVTQRETVEKRQRETEKMGNRGEETEG
jgi:hypothetical protein